ncbi:MAG: (d)CMP kinase [Candidatus Omnitrophica bacterium]|nr:(d)CMP kinase [Candidatus Omnitrophota bacterium]
MTFGGNKKKCPGFIAVAIDGPAGAGKSTVAKRLAQRLGFAFLDTGAMYRALTLKAMRLGLKLEDELALTALAQNTKIDLEDKGEGLIVSLDGEDVSQNIRTVEVTNNTFYIARVSGVRAILVRWQQEIGACRNVVAEGRDIGTVVFPRTKYKFYLDADVEERAKRRHAELTAKGKPIDFEEVLKDVRDRDHKDFTRKVGPLKKAEDAVVIDSTKMTVEEVIDTLCKHIIGETKDKMTKDKI